MTTPSPTEPQADPLGHAVLAARLEAVPGLLRAMRDAWPSPSSRTSRSESFVVTGIGSSEAHARYLAWELNRSGDPAEFVPLSAFDGTGAPVPGASGRTLVLFSQGLSRNVRLVLAARRHFARVVLFTAASATGLIQAGHAERAAWLQELEREGAEIVRFPLQNEYEILIRVVGPACGFLAARLWLDSRAPASAAGASILESILTPSACPLAPFLAEQLPGISGGFRLLVPPALAQCSQNLACKMVEGLFWSPPQILDVLSFAHGPFQQLAARPAPVVILRPAADAVAADQADRALTMCRTLNLPAVSIPLNAPAGWQVLEADLRFNEALPPLVTQLRVNQRDWPGRGADAPLYLYP
jgi:creatinine amidohydrolase